MKQCIININLMIVKNNYNYSYTRHSSIPLGHMQFLASAHCLKSNYQMLKPFVPPLARNLTAPRLAHWLGWPNTSNDPNSMHVALVFRASHWQYPSWHATSCFLRLESASQPPQLKSCPAHAYIHTYICIYIQI